MNDPLNIYININISRKSKFYWDHFGNIVFCPFLRKYQSPTKRHLSLDLFEKNVFSTFQGKLRYFGITSKKSLFVHMFKKYQHIEKNYVILRSLLKMIFYPYRRNINISMKMTFFRNYFFRISVNINLSGRSTSFVTPFVDQCM